MLEMNTNSQVAKFNLCPISEAKAQSCEYKIRKCNNVEMKGFNVLRSYSLSTKLRYKKTGATTM